MSNRKRTEDAAERITKYWDEQGFKVKAYVVRDPWVRGVNTPGYSVRTDMRNALPRTHPTNQKDAAPCHTSQKN